MKEAATKESNDRLLFGVGTIDSFTKGLKKGELVVLGSRPVIDCSLFAWNLIDRVLKQNKKVLYVSLSDFKKKIIEHHPEEAGRNLIICDEYVWIDDISRNAGSISDLDLVVIDYVEAAWNSIYHIKNNIYHQLKHMAKNIGVPVLALSRLNRKLNEELSGRTSVENICRGLLKEGKEDIDYMFLFYPPLLKKYIEDYNYACDEGETELEARLISFKTGKEKTEYLVYNKNTYEFREYSKKIRRLLNVAKLMGLSTEDAIEYAFYWENRECPEDKKHERTIDYGHSWI